MSLKGGYFKKGLWVDLTRGAIETRGLADAFLERYIGGRGFGAKLVWDNLREHDFKIDPLGAENLLVVAPGPLSGVYLPSSGKNSFVAISPATGLYGDSSMGGGFGVELRQTGIDLLSVAGRAAELSVLFIDGDGAKVIPMPELKGKSCLQAEGLIKERLGSHIVHMATIGVAGENMVGFACISADWGRNAGRTGLGTVMGSKNLKAIALQGNKDLPVYDMSGLVAEADKAYGYMKEHPFFKMWQRQGLMNVIDYANETGILPAYNFKDSVFARYQQINGTTMLNHYKIGDSACFACPMCCGNICLVKSGKYVGTVVEGPEYETCAMLGPNLGIDDFAAVLSAARLCDELGLDTISTGSIVAAVIEGYEKGILSLADLDGREITWGDDDAILELIRKIAHREGVGDILAGGSRRIIETWPEMDKVILQVKGLEQSAYDSRASISMALAYATSDIGAHHTRAWTIAKEMEEGSNWSDDERVGIVIYHQKLRPLFDMFGVCRLPWIELGLNELHYERFYNCVTGGSLSLDELLELSNDVYDLTRLANVRLGMSRRDDSLPYKVRTNPPLTGPNAGKVINQEDFQRLLTLYYQKRGWDENGVPPASLAEKFNDRV
ncbi:MAG TPA: aldehyde ferredoxin oxidoreductase family protein [Dehalococcoidia bacterium]|nr:aldehyde ferredoxin oxidoreductase family protein [Dehalococcoidia bacterium]